jgi:hypothetical protein
MKPAFSNISMQPRAALGNSVVAVWVAGAALLFVGGYLVLNGMYANFIALVILATFVMVWQADRTASIGMVLVFLIVLGDIRRITGLLFSSSALDPLLIVSAIFCLYLSLPILFRLRLSDNLSKLVLAMMALMTLEMFNPQQGSLFVGLVGGLFFLMPLFWYWVGRTYATAKMIHSLLFRVLLPLTIVNVLIGYYQMTAGALPWQEQWVRQVGGQVLFAKGHLRAFGFSTSVSEYGGLLIIATVWVMAAIVSKQRVYALLLPFLLVSIVVAGGRSAPVRVVFSAAILWAVLSRNAKAWLPRLLFALFLGAAGTLYLASHATVDDTREANTATLATNRVATGLSDSRRSSANDHKDMMVGGFITGFKNPLGFGLGYTTLAHTKFGGTGGSSETDISDLFIATGFPGGLLYMAIIALTCLRLADYRKKNSGLLPLTLIGIMASLLGGWFGEGQYSMQFLLFFCIGFVSREAQPGRENLRPQVAPHQVKTMAAVN